MSDSEQARKSRPELKRRVPVQRAERVRLETFVPATWRLIVTSAADGALNMAIDEALAEAVAGGRSLPVLRLYTWQPPCLSLGHAQPIEAVDAARCAELGWEIVRRATGGRAVLHIDELTYTVCAPDDEPRVAGGVLESYRRLSAGLLRGLRGLGLEPERAQSVYEDRGEQGPACFDGPSDYEITIGQRKLLGSAQLRRRGVVLQHGALPLAGDITRIADVLNLSLGQRLALRNRLRFRATTLELALGRLPDAAEVGAQLADGFAEALGITWQRDTLTPAEQARAAEIRAEKYANPEWTGRL